MSARTLGKESEAWAWTLPILAARREIERQCESFAAVCKSVREAARTPHTRFFHRDMFCVRVECPEGVNALAADLKKAMG